MAEATTTQAPGARARFALRYNLAFALLALAFVARYYPPDARRVYDDAFIFYRYAALARAGEGYTFNPGGPRVDGITAPTWLATVIAAWPLQRGTIDGPALFLGTLSFAAGLAWLLAFLVALARALPPAWKPAAGPLTIVIVLHFRLFGAHLWTGMETQAAALLAVLYVAIFAEWVARDPDATPAHDQTGRIAWRGAVVGVLGMALLLTRPEAGLLALGAPAIVAWQRRHAGRGALARRSALACLETTVSLLVVDAFWRWAYFGRLLPLPFLVKGSAGSPRFATYEPIAALLTSRLYAEFLVAAAPTLLGVAWLLWRGDALARLAWLWVPWIAIVGYLSTTMQIMGIDLRYYWPYLPLAFLAGAYALSRDAAPAPARHGTRGWVLLLAALVAWCTLMLSYQADLEPFDDHPDALGLRFHVHLERAVSERLAQIRQPMTIAATEVGYLGALNLRSTIIDLSGLNDPGFVGEFYVATLFARRPDVIALVHPHYRGIVHYIPMAGEFGNYERVFTDGPQREGDQLYRAIWVRRDSPAYRQLLAPEEGGRRRGAQTPG